MYATFLRNAASYRNTCLLAIDAADIHADDVAAIHRNVKRLQNEYQRHLQGVPQQAIDELTRRLDAQQRIIDDLTRRMDLLTGVRRSSQQRPAEDSA